MASDRLPAAATRETEQFLDEARVEHDVPGLSVAVFDRDSLRYVAGMGARDIESRAPATPDTRYSVGSVTKVFTAMAVLQLVDRGELALDDAIHDYVDVWNDVPGDPITVGELLRHASGMPADYVGRREVLFADAPPASPVLTREDDHRHADGAADRRIVDPERYRYSTRGYQILGEVVAAVTDRPFAEYVESELFAPLGMDRSQVGYDELADLGEDTATGYVVEDGEPVANSHDLNDEIRTPHSGGGVLSSVTDLAAAGRCLLNDGELDGERVLSADRVAGMCTHQAPTLKTIDGREVGFGHGPGVKEFLGETLAGHTGTVPGISRAYLGVLPERGVGVALGVNTPDVPVGTLGQGVLAIATGASPRATVPSLSLQEKCERVAGTYEGYRGGVTVAVAAADSSTHVEVTYEDGPDWAFPAFPESVAHDEYAFYRIREGGVREPVTFHETDEGMELRCNVDRLRRTGPGA